MYFNDSGNNTNIDKEFGGKSSNNNEKESNKKPFNFKILFIILGILILLFFLYFYFSKNKTEIFLTLEGNTDIILYQNDTYNDPGFKAYDNHGNDLANNVIVTGSVNTATAGDYTVTYTLDDIVKERHISVIAKTEQKTYLILEGESTIFLKVGEEYKEPGYKVIDTLESGLESKVKVSGTIDKAAGTYKLKYSVTNKSGVTVSAERTVIITDSNISVSYTPNALTNKNVKINVKVVDNYFDYVLLPDGSKKNNREFDYEVKQNGTYKFVMYSKDGTAKDTTVTVSNIDKEAPKVTSCKGTITDGKTTLTVTSSDTDIVKYIFADSYDSTGKTITINKELPNTSVKVIDKASNETSATCSATYTYDKPIDPKGSENIIHKENTTSLRVWIEKKTRGSRTGYYVTHVWAMNPYKQMKSGVPNNFGKELLTAKDIFVSAISRNKLSNKLAVAMNGSGFALDGVFSTDMIRYNHGYNKTSVSPIVISEGKVLRDFAKDKVASSGYVVYGLKKDGNFAYYKYTYGNNVAANVTTSNQIISDGVLDTWAFSPVLVLDGKVVSNDTSKNIRNGICQIDKNNFVIITDIYKSPRDGFCFKELAEYMVSLGCKTGFNFDGGGSTTLLFKSKNSSSPTQITNGTRSIADILYFHEL